MSVIESAIRGLPIKQPRPGRTNGVNCMPMPVRECEMEIRVRYAECDPMGFLHHSRYFEYFEMGRTELLRASGFRYRDLEERGVLFVVTKIECRFRRPAAYDDLLKLQIKIVRQGRARIDHEYKLYRDGVLLCEAATVLACINRQGQPIPIPQEMGGQVENEKGEERGER